MDPPPGTSQVSPTAKPVADVPALVEKLVVSPAFTCISERFLAPDLDAHADVVGAIGEANARIKNEKNTPDNAIYAPLKRRAFESVRRIAKLYVSDAPMVADLVDHGPPGAPENILGAEYALYAGNHERARELLRAHGPPKWDFQRHAAVYAALGDWDQAVDFETSFEPIHVARAIVEMSPYAKDPATVRRAVQHYLEVIKQNRDDTSIFLVIRRLRQLGVGAESRPLRAYLATAKDTSELVLLWLAGELIALGESVPSTITTRIASMGEGAMTRQARWRNDVFSVPVPELLTRLSAFTYEGNDLWSALVRHIEAGLEPTADATLTKLCRDANE